jgi:hypothetical protein
MTMFRVYLNLPEGIYVYCNVFDDWEPRNPDVGNLSTETTVTARGTGLKKAGLKATMQL